MSTKRSRCVSKTLRDQRCKNPSTPGSAYCKQHLDCAIKGQYGGGNDEEFLWVLESALEDANELSALVNFLETNNLDLNRMYDNVLPVEWVAGYTEDIDNAGIVLSTLLEHGADPNQQDDGGYTALMALYLSALDRSRWTLNLLNKKTRLLKKYGADPNIKNNLGETVYDIAKKQGVLDILEKYY